MKQKKLFASALMSLLVLGASAQEKELSSYHFIEAQGGMQFTSTNAKITNLLSPTYGISYGFMGSTLGGRLNVNGMKAKGKLASLDQEYNWKYCTADFDMLLNLTNLFSKNDSHLINLMLVGGIGLTHTWDQELQATSVKHDYMQNLRAGVRLETNVTKPFGLSLEIDANNTSDHFNGKLNNSDDWRFTAMLGLSYRFGFKYKDKIVTPTKVSAKTFTVVDEELGAYQMMTNRLNSEMDVWEKQMPNESLEAYQERVNANARALEAQKRTYDISTEMAMATTQLAAPVVTLGGYNPRLKKMAVKVASVPDIYLDMDESEVGDLYNNKDLKLKNAKYTLKEDNSYELVYAEIENPMTGKTYIYDNLQNKSMSELQMDPNFVPVAAIVEASNKKKALEDAKNNMANLTKQDEITAGNTHIFISAMPEIATNEKGQEIVNYNVAMSYEVEENFSTRDDFKPGQYHAEDSKAAQLMLATMKKAFENDFAKYLAEGKRVKIVVTGMADASPISRAIEYDGKYGNFKQQAVRKNGSASTITLTKAEGISNNDQLAFARAAGVQNYIQKEIPSLNKMKQDTEYVIEVSKLTGGKYRRINVQCIFVDAF